MAEDIKVSTFPKRNVLLSPTSSEVFSDGPSENFRESDSLEYEERRSRRLAAGGMLFKNV